MRFLVTMSENRTASSMERVACLQHRLKSLDYQKQLLVDKRLGYAFRSEDASTSYLMFKDIRALEDLDELVKGDPSWAYCSTEVMPVTTTASMMREMYKSLGPKVLGEEFEAKTMAALEGDEEPIDEDGTYSLAAKRAKDISAITSPDLLNEMWSRVIESQRLHLNSTIEFADHNPVGKPWGILIGKTNVSELQQHVESAPIFPDTDVTFENLLTLKQARNLTAMELERSRRAVPKSALFDM
ncbi:hypothetical protein [Rhizobium alvei]|uniref:Uncharacterized protein n=1 Tax=Rhizobium alvei TaxID=1132659 RepID=A0ABT8YTT2_9HYPH|nr:hypothetical protein [Rhizobium alvei]MDO6967113.1 hypothetical protein [Rhizobium alvei]